MVPPQVKTRSSGVVVVRRVDGVWFFLLLRSYRNWDFPKGKNEEGETLLETAIREVREETGIKDLKFNWGEDSYTTEPYSRGVKTATYFVAETTEHEVVMGVNDELGKPEHDEYRWFSYNDAKFKVVDRVKKVIDWAMSNIA